MHCSLNVVHCRSLIFYVVKRNQCLLYFCITCWYVHVRVYSMKINQSSNELLGKIDSAHGRDIARTAGSNDKSCCVVRLNDQVRRSVSYGAPIFSSPASSLASTYNQYLSFTLTSWQISFFSVYITHLRNTLCILRSISCLTYFVCL